MIAKHASKLIHNNRLSTALHTTHANHAHRRSLCCFSTILCVDHTQLQAQTSAVLLSGSSCQPILAQPRAVQESAESQLASNKQHFNSEWKCITTWTVAVQLTRGPIKQKSLTMCDSIISARKSSWKDVLTKWDEDSSVLPRAPARTFTRQSSFTHLHTHITQRGPSTCQNLHTSIIFHTSTHPHHTAWPEHLPEPSHINHLSQVYTHTSYSFSLIRLLLRRFSVGHVPQNRWGTRGEMPFLSQAGRPSCHRLDILPVTGHTPSCQVGCPSCPRPYASCHRLDALLITGQMSFPSQAMASCHRLDVLPVTEKCQNTEKTQSTHARKLSHRGLSCLQLTDEHLHRSSATWTNSGKKASWTLTESSGA